MIEVKIKNIPSDILNNFCDHCDIIAGLENETSWTIARDEALAKDNATFIRTELKLAFKSEECCTMFLLRWS